MAYDSLDKRVRETYRKGTEAKKVKIDSYIRAFRLASDRVGKKGIVAFVTNGGWLDSLGTDGMRRSMEEEFSDVFVFNLRGNQRTAGEESAKEGGKVFGSGSRASVAITIAVKNPNKSDFTLKYKDIGDFLSAEEKLEIVARSSIGSIDWIELHPNEYGDWISQRTGDFSEGIPLSGEKSKGYFAASQPGVSTNRDAWAYASSRGKLLQNIKNSISYFNSYEGGEAEIDKSQIKWSDGFARLKTAGKKLEFLNGAVRDSLYRPFYKQNLYVGEGYLERAKIVRETFPGQVVPNIGIYVSGKSSNSAFSVLATDSIPNLHFQNSGQFLSRFVWKPSDSGDGGLFVEGGVVKHAETSIYGEVGEVVDGYVRVDNITDEIKQLYRDTLGDDVTGDDIFHFVYGKLHDPVYRTKYAADLKKTLPHIEAPSSRGEFDKFVTAGKELMDLHVNYESVEPWPLDIQVKGDESDRETWRVKKMKRAKRKDPETGENVNNVTNLIYNKQVTIGGIPAEADKYMLGSRSALAWLIDRYQVRKDKTSGIVNDPNDWADEVGNPRYIVDLIGKVTRVAMETVRIVDGLVEEGSAVES